MYEVCALKESRLTIGEFKSILGEIYNFCQNGNDSFNHYCRILLTHYSTFFGMQDNDVIPAKQSRLDNDMNNVYYVQFPVDFKPTCQRVNKQVILGETNKCKQLKEGKSCSILKKMEDPRKRDCLLKNDTKMKNIEKHLRQFDHGQLLPFENCPFGINCKQFNNLCKSTSQNADVKDIVHMHLFRHPDPPHDLVTNTINAGNNSNELSDFEYIGSGEYTRPNVEESILLQGVGKLCGVYNDNYQNIMLLLLMQEVIANDFEEELEPIKSVVSRSDDNYFNHVLKQHKVDDLISSIFEGDMDKYDYDYKHVEPMQRRIESINWDNIIKDLKKEYKILDKLETKMNHTRHVKLGLPLKKHEMAAIILYTDAPDTASCMNDLCQQLRKQDWNNCNIDTQEFGPKKWKCFDFALYCAIARLSKYETHDENIYTGLAGIYLDATKFDSEQNNHLLLKTYTSFSTDLSVAKDFTASNGLIIGINMKNGKKIYYNENVGSMFDNIDGMSFDSIANELNVRMQLSVQEQSVGLLCCDVSWISKYSTEIEVLMAKHSILPISRKHIFDNYKPIYQYVISSASTNRNENVSFVDMFCKYTKPNYY